MKKRKIPWLSLPIIGFIVFLFQRERNANAYTWCALSVSLYGYTFFSFLLGKVLLAIFPYFLEDFLTVLLKVNIVIIVWMYLLLALSEILDWEERLLILLPWLRPLRDDWLRSENIT